MLTHYQQCILPNVPNPSEATIAAHTAAKDRQGKNRVSATKSDTAMAVALVQKRKTREERDDQKHGRVKSMIDKYFQVMRIASIAWKRHLAVTRIASLSGKQRCDAYRIN